MINHDTPEAIAITDKAARELLIAELRANKEILVYALKHIAEHTSESKTCRVANSAIKKAGAL